MHGRRNNSDVEGGGVARPSRRGGGGTSGGGGGLSSGEANSGILETQNNEYIDELSNQVARLKGLTIDIGNEVQEQNSLLDGMGDGFQNVGDMLGSSLNQIGTMLSSGGTKHMLLMVTFCVAIMCLLWWLMSSSK
eukprot:CAMPEP_0198139910 /NCGR_PEP_ID=MMETSP1443-20131203/3141_1 /TAXON_ID=186043 /ORGANISM="Entomoneis sp., Strain CCMP2396" /LENGTH=134 /DNA_ID=CAMNT_0043802175 /DNA_START=253 /DNA_END=657 /DNA_ORIENTATION=-